MASWGSLGALLLVAPLLLVSYVAVLHSPSASADSAEVMTTVTTNRMIYRSGEPVIITVNLTNTGSDSVILHYSGPGIYYEVWTLQGRLVYDFYWHATWLWYFWDRTLAPGETWTSTFSFSTDWWPQVYDNGTSVPWPGYYGIGGCSPSLEPVTGGNCVVFIGDQSVPVASIGLSNNEIQSGETINVNASESTNLMGTSSYLQYRWDWEGDGIWDTGWSDSPFETHVYPISGEYNLSLEVMDPTGLTSTNVTKVTVSGTAVPEYFGIALPATLLLAVFLLLRVRKKGFSPTSLSENS